MDLIEQFLEYEMGFGGLFLLLADPITKALGEVDANKIEALRLEIPKMNGIPPEIASHGLHSIGNFMRQMGYDWTRVILLTACKTIK